MKLYFRPIDIWPGVLLEPHQRKTAPFQATWSNTLRLLDHELRQLGAEGAVIQVAAPESAMRIDGGLRADARPSHPGVILSFDTGRHGPLRYFTDRYTGGVVGWQANARAIALGLEALRKIDRYGIASRGEQYTGWRQIGAAAEPAHQMTVDRAARILHDAAGHSGRAADIASDPDLGKRLYRTAARVTHPDAGGDGDAFQELQEAMRVLGEHWVLS